MGKTAKRGIDWAPQGNVVFAPVPFKLLRVMRREGKELVAGPDMGDYQGHVFDPWRKGDLVVVEHETSAWYAGIGTKRSVSWRVGYHASTPSASTAKIDWGSGAGHALSRGDTLWRLPYIWRSTAAKLVGQTFETKAALELAMDAAQAGLS